MKYQIKEINNLTKITYDECKLLIQKNLINEKNKINPYITRLLDLDIKSRKIENLIDNIYYYTSFLNEEISFKKRVSLILLNIKEYPICKCNKIIDKIYTISGKVRGFTQYCSQSCANRFTNYKRSSEFYQSFQHKIVEVRKRKKNYIAHESFIYSNSIEKYPEKVKQRKLTNLSRYGVENPGVLGAYSSKSAEKFIRNYIKENDIDENLCYFKNGGINNKEYFQNVFVEHLNKYVYFSYDLVVFNKDKKHIILVLEYNGPWHYTYEQMKTDENGNANPYPKSKSRIETYNFDIFKLNTIRKKCENIWIYWNNKYITKLIKYDGIKL